MSTSQSMSFPFIRLYALSFLYFSANSILNVIIPLRSQSLGASNTEIGIIMGTYMLTCMFFRPWAGQVVQRYGAIPVLRVLVLINAVVLGLYTISGMEGYIAVRALQGAATALFSMAMQMGIVDALPEKERSQGVSLYSLSTYLPTVIGPLAALSIWEMGGMNAFTMVMLTLGIVTGLVGFSSSLKMDARVKDNSELSFILLLKQFGQLWYNQALLICSVVMLLESVVFGAVTTFLPLYAVQSGQGNAGIYLMLQAGVVVIIRFTLRKKIPSDGKWHTGLIVGLLLVAALGALMLAVTAKAGPVVLYASAVLLGTAMALIYPTIMTYLTFTLPSSSRNVLIGLFIATADLGISLGGMLMGLVADYLSYSAMYAVCSMLSLTAALVALSSGRRMNTYQSQ